MINKSPLKYAFAVFLGILCVTGIYFFQSNGGNAAAKQKETFYGAAAAQVDEALTVEEMIKYAMEEEYLSEMEYEDIIENYGAEEPEPFSTILQHERHNIRRLKQLSEQYNINVNQDEAMMHIIYPSSLEQAYKEAIQLQINTISMYERFLDQDLPQDIEEALLEIKNQEQKDLLAFKS